MYDCKLLSKCKYGVKLLARVIILNALIINIGTFLIRFRFGRRSIGRECSCNRKDKIIGRKSKLNKLR